MTDVCLNKVIVTWNCHRFKEDVLYIYCSQRCYKCRRQFDDEPDIHHCRSCGEGFCDSCSANKMRVPERGWGDMLVRVCDACYGDGASMNGK